MVVVMVLCQAGPQPGFPRLLPPPQAPEHSAVQEQHGGAGQEEGADRGVDDVVVVLQLALVLVAIRHLFKDSKTRQGKARQVRFICVAFSYTGDAQHGSEKYGRRAYENQISD